MSRIKRTAISFVKEVIFPTVLTVIILIIVIELSSFKF